MEKNELKTNSPKPRKSEDKSSSHQLKILAFFKTMPEFKARQVIPIWEAKGQKVGQTLCPQYIVRKFINLLSELVVAISVFHKRDQESDSLTTDTST